MVIDKNTILYFSGTGNSLQVAKDIRDKLGNVQLCNLVSLKDEKDIVIKTSLLGIVFPVYYARMPLIVEEVVKKLEVPQETYVFAAATYAGGPAKALIKVEKALQSRDIVLNAGFLIKMPGNNIFYFGAQSKSKQKKLFDKEKKTVERVVNTIKEAKNEKCEVSKLIIDIIIDRMSIKTTDQIMKNLPLRDNKFWVNDKCNSCGLCKKICPVHNIEFDKDKPLWKHNCQQCAACIQYCPKEAIQWGDKSEKRKRYKNPNVKVVELLNNN